MNLSIPLANLSMLISTKSLPGAASNLFFLLMKKTINALWQHHLLLGILSEFVELQEQILIFFQQSFPQISDRLFLIDCPKSGFFSAAGEEWKFQKHGTGINFVGQNTGQIIDVHCDVFSSPRRLDSWRLCQYFDSIGIDQIVYSSHVFEVSDEDGTEALLNFLITDFNWQFPPSDNL
jgi:hypothetical protein